MSNPYFQFKQFTVWHDRCAMKVGTDAVLLGAWVQAEGAYSLLDVGTGSGIVALILAQRVPHAHIDAIEIDAPAAQQACSNVSLSPWSGRVHVECADFSCYATARRYDHIVSNPPFFSNALRNPDEKRSMARHDSTLSYGQLFAQASALLNPDGRMSVIVPAEVECRVVDKAWDCDLHPVRMTRVFTKLGKPCRRVLITFAGRAVAESMGACVPDSLCLMNAGGTYTDAYRQLVSPLYLNM